MGLSRHLAEWIGSLGLTKFQLLIALLVLHILLACFLDGISMGVLTMGVILPTIFKAGSDPLWFGIFLVVVVKMAQITPPARFNPFVLQRMTRRQLPYVCRVTMPMFLSMMGGVIFFTRFQASPPGCRSR
jgi:C4-dicarboxylate transporter, DctM subunit